MLEETGYLAGAIIRLGAFYSSPGIMTEKMYAYAATDLEQSTQALDEGEEIEVVPTRFDEAIEMIGGRTDRRWQINRDAADVRSVSPKQSAMRG